MKVELFTVKITVKITEETFRKFAKLITRIAGIELADNRSTMLVNRVSARLAELGIASFEEYYELVASPAATAERQALIDSVATNFTSFFRDEDQFMHVRDELVRLFESGQRRVRLWSAACSTGEEPYSLAITALQAAAQAGVVAHDIRILATDISNRVLQDAYQGFYTASSIQKLNPLHRTHFEPSKRSECTGETLVRVNKQLRELVIFRNVNLCESPPRVPHEIDVIFCRNVLLYFNTKTRRAILDTVTSRLRTGGLLYVGASEQIRNLIPQMANERASVFRNLAAAPSPLESSSYAAVSVHNNSHQCAD